MKKTAFILALFAFSFSISCFSQGLMNDLGSEITISDLVTESVKAISTSKRIFILSNENRSFARGDFISLVFNNKITARAIVATLKKSSAGIKIIKIYSWNTWQQLAIGSQLQIIRGDDSFFREKSKKDEASMADQDLIKSEEDLFNEVEIHDEKDIIDENKDLLIKQDHMFSLSYGQISNLASDNSTVGYSQFSGTYSYQLSSNFWLEGVFGQTVAKDYPSTGLDTSQLNVTFRAKYLFKIPFYCYLAPYLGYQLITTDSPGAGEDSSGETSDADLQEELTKVDNLAKSHLVFGVSILRHLVPGWYARLDAGTDIISLGFGLEF